MNLSAMHVRTPLAVFCALLCIAAFGAEPLPVGAPTAAVRYSVQSTEGEPLSWGGFLTVNFEGPLAANWSDETLWKIAFNGLPVKVRKVFAGESAGVLRLIVDRPDGGIDASGVALLGKSKFGANRVKILLEHSGRRMEPLSETANVVWINNVRPSRAKIFLVIVVAVVVLLVWAIFRTGIIRDGDKRIADPKLRPFSLSKSQLAVWITLVMLGYVLLFLLTGKSVELFNMTALALIGIGTLTTGISTTWASDKVKAVEPASDATGQAAPPAMPAAPAPAPAPAQSEGILDLISDAEGPNIHRLQMALWTLVFAGVFVTKLIDELAFPDFDAETFYLMGISSGTYVWFKKREK